MTVASIAQGAELAHELAQIRYRRGCVAHGQYAEIGWAHIPWQPFEQRGSEHRFDVTQDFCRRGLGDEHLFGCDAQVVRASEGVEQLKMSETQLGQDARRMHRKLSGHGVYTQELITGWDRLY